MRSKSIELALYSEGYLPLLLCFTLYLRANSKYKPPGLYFEGRFGGAIWRGDLTERFLRFPFGELIFGGAYTWRALFSEFYGIYRFSSKLVRMTEKYANSKMDFSKFFCLRSNPSNDDKLSV